jgi:hypothetical protein
MKLYIKDFSSYRSDLDLVDIKKTIKQKYKLDTRRQDDFIHLGLYGAAMLKEKTAIDADDELYVTSGIGNVDIVHKTNTCIYEDKRPLKLFDFINLLGNTTSYHIASSLGVKGKNIFCISDNFTYINTLIMLYASISQSQKNGILCSIDLAGDPDEIIKRVLGVDEKTKLISSVNTQKFSLDAIDAKAELEFETSSYTLDEVQTFLKTNKTNIMTSFRCKELDFLKEDVFFETYASYAINNAIEKNEDLVYIDCFEDRYKILKVKSLI